MAKMTLLELVQSILRSIESDEVNSISDTPDADMAADIVKEVYFQMIPWASNPEFVSSFFTLDALADSTKPTYLKLPTTVDELYWWKYDTQISTDTEAKYKEIKWLAPEDFFEFVHARDLDDTNVISYNTDDGVPLYIKNDEAPTHYTILDDENIVCDSFDNTVDSTLQSSKTVAAGLKHPTFTKSDSFTPDLDTNMFPFLLSESQAVAHAEIKQQINQKKETQVREQKVRTQNQRHRFQHRNSRNSITHTSNFGRK